jgi:hypothetical protein
MNGPKKIMGSIFIMIAVERITAVSVLMFTYQTNANTTTELPNMEAAWLLQRTKNFFSVASPSLVQANHIQKAAQVSRVY